MKTNVVIYQIAPPRGKIFRHIPISIMWYPEGGRVVGLTIDRCIMLSEMLSVDMNIYLFWKEHFFWNQPK